LPPGHRQSIDLGTAASDRLVTQDRIGSSATICGSVPVRVLVVIDGLGTGGAERSLAELVPFLKARGFEFEIAFFHDRRPGVEDVLRKEQVQLRRIEGRIWTTRCVQLRREIRRFAPALVHATLVGAAITARVAAAGTGVPVLTTLVGTTYTPPAPLSRRGPRRTIIRTVDSWTARHLNAGFHAISHAVATDAAASLGIDEDAIIVVPRGRTRARLGWPSQDRSARVRLGLGVPRDSELLLTVGRQEERKGHVTLVEAWAEIADARLRAHLVIAGRSGLASPAIGRALDDLPVEARQRVHLVGHTEDVGGLLSAADVFAFPSRHEGLGGALLEALAMSLPVVASDLPAFREFLVPGENGILVPPGCASAFADAAVRLLSDESQRARMGAANLELFERRFQMDTVAQQTERLYLELAAARDEVD
jgi:glycosyltransferase involved in cell wall biosynthesis